MTLKDAQKQNDMAYSFWLADYMPENDEYLNNSNRNIIKAYISEYPDAMGYKFHKGIVDIKSTEKLHNFCCDYVFDGIVGNCEKVQKAHEQFLSSGSLDDLDILRETLENANGICLIWS